MVPIKYVLISLSFSLLAFAAEPPINRLDVYVPTIITPKSNEVWTVGEKKTVTWKTYDAPEHITNPQGKIFLRKGLRTTPLILAENFNIIDGIVDVTVPTVVTGSDYRLVLFGDSGDFSQVFTISNPEYDKKPLLPADFASLTSNGADSESSGSDQKTEGKTAESPTHSATTTFVFPTKGVLIADAPRQNL